MASLAALVKSVAVGLLVAFQATADASSNTNQMLLTDKIEPYVLNVPAGARRSDTIKAASAKYLSVHFAHFQLPPGDKVIVRSVDGQASFEFEGLGRGDHGLDGGFYSPVIAGDSVIVEYVVAHSSAGNDSASSGSTNGVAVGAVGLDGNADGALGYRIDHISRSINSASPSSKCGSDDQSKNAQCFENDIELPSAYTKSRAVARLYSQHFGFCTGWLLGSEGHLMTNSHCIKTQKDADNVEYEFMVEIPCKTKPPRGKLATRGIRVATTATLVAMSPSDVLDYALVKLNATVDLSQFGYLTLRVAGPEVNEEVYVPQHPVGEPKRLATVRQDDKRTHVVRIEHTDACNSIKELHHVLHDADTQGGSSGSPLLATRDNKVIGLHNCGGCAKENDELVTFNAAIDARAIVRDLLAKNALPRDSVDDAPEKAQDGPWMPGYKSRAAPAPTPAPTPASTPASTPAPTPASTPAPTPAPTPEPTPAPVAEPTPAPTQEPTPEPTPEPTSSVPAPASTPPPLVSTSPEPSLRPTPDPIPVTDPVPTPTPSADSRTLGQKIKDFFDGIWGKLKGMFGKK